MLTDMLAGGQHVDRNNMPTAMLSGKTCRRTYWQGRHADSHVVRKNMPTDTLAGTTRHRHDGRDDTSQPCCQEKHADGHVGRDNMLTGRLNGRCCGMLLKN